MAALEELTIFAESILYTTHHSCIDLKKIYWTPIMVFIALCLLMLISGCGSDGGGGTILGTIRGSVYDASTHNPVASAVVTIGSCYTAMTTSSGEYFVPISAGVYNIRIEAPGYISVEMFDIEVWEGDDTVCDASMTADGSNTPPDRPVLVTPADGETEVSLRPMLTTQPFEDSDDSDHHIKSHWQTATDLSFEDSTRIVDLTSDNALTTLNSELIFEPNTSYYWRVRFFDSLNAASEWSEPYSFTTAVDTDMDNMPDYWENLNGLDPTINDAEQDPDNDGFTNLEEYCLETDPWNPPSGPGAVIMGFVRGGIINARNDDAVRAQILTSGGIVAESSQYGNYFMVHPVGKYSIMVSADKYYRATDMIVVSEATTTYLDVELTPTTQESGGGSSNGGGCFIEIIRTLSLQETNSAYCFHCYIIGDRLIFSIPK